MLSKSIPTAEVNTVYEESSCQSAPSATDIAKNFEDSFWLISVNEKGEEQLRIVLSVAHRPPSGDKKARVEVLTRAPYPEEETAISSVGYATYH